MLVAPKIDKTRAESLLSGTGIFRFRRKKILKAELIWMPVYLFTVTVEDKRGREDSGSISVDGLKGEFSLYNESGYLQSESVIMNKVGFRISEHTARDIGMAEFSRMLFRNNMKIGHPGKLKSISEGIRVHYPYWIGYFRIKNGYDFEVIDAVGGNRQGVRMKPLFMDALANNLNT